MLAKECASKCDTSVYTARDMPIITMGTGQSMSARIAVQTGMNNADNTDKEVRVEDLSKYG